MNKLYLLLISGMMVSVAYGSQQKQDPNTALATALYNHYGNRPESSLNFQKSSIGLPSVTSQRPTTVGCFSVSRNQTEKRTSSSVGVNRSSIQSCPKISTSSHASAIESFAKIGNQRFGGSSQSKSCTVLKDFERDFDDADDICRATALLGVRAGRTMSPQENNVLDQERVASVSRTQQKRNLQRESRVVSERVQNVESERASSQSRGNKARVGVELSKQETETAQKLALIGRKKERYVDTTRPLTLDEWLRYVASITHENEDVVHKQREYDRNFASIEQTINSLKKEVGYLVNRDHSFLSDQEKTKVAQLKAMQKSLEETRSVLTVNLLDFRREKLMEALKQKKLCIDTSDLEKHKEGTWTHNFVVMALKSNNQKTQ